MRERVSESESEIKDKEETITRKKGRTEGVLLQLETVCALSPNQIESYFFPMYPMFLNNNKKRKDERMTWHRPQPDPRKGRPTRADQAPDQSLIRAPHGLTTLRACHGPPPSQQGRTASAAAGHPQQPGGDAL